MIRRFFTRILMVILIGVCVYNGVQISRLQREVRFLETASKRQRTVSAPTEISDIWLTRANAHAAHASADLARGDISGAQSEMEHGTNDLRQAAAEPAAHAAKSVRELARQLTILQARAQSLQARTGPQAQRLLSQTRVFAAEAKALLHQ